MARRTISPRLILIGAGLIATTPVVWWAFTWLKWPLSRELPADVWAFVYFTPFAANVLSFAGFILISAGLMEPRGRVLGGVFGALLYIAPAYLFWVGWSTVNYHHAEWGEASFIAANWPLLIAFNLNWFGYGPN